MIEQDLLTNDEMKAIYQKLKKETYEFSEQYETSISEKHWNPDRPADRERYFVVQSRERIQEIIAQAQQLKTASLYQAKITVLQTVIDHLLVDNSVLEQGMVDKQKEIEALKAQIHFLNKQLENQDTYIYKIKNSIART